MFSLDVPLSSSRRKVGRPKGSCGTSSKKSVKEKNTVKKRPGRPPKVRLSVVYLKANNLFVYEV